FLDRPNSHGIEAMSTSAASSLAPSCTPGFWRRFAVAFGPTLVGLLGGVLAGGFALATTAVLLHNCAATYAKFPSLPRPWLAVDLDLPGPVLILFGALGVAAPFAMGLAAALLARPRDRWEDLSAGVNTALAGTLSGYASGLGWAVTL